MNLNPFQWLTLDIETIAGSPDDAERFIAERWQPDSIASWAEITIGKRAKEALAKKKERLSLLSAAPIICISLRSEQGISCIHCLDKTTIANLENGALICAEPNIEQMLITLRVFLDHSVSPDTVIVGHNITNFDLPKLRWAYTRHGLRMPEVLAAARLNIYDIMQVYTRQFAVGSSCMVALNSLLEEFGVDSHKSLVSGSDVQQLYDDGAHDTIVQYAILDVIAESELYLRMTGRSETLQ